MLQENIINRYIKKINAELNNCGSSSPRLISLKVLYPSNTNQKELQPLLALCKEIEYSEYFEFEKKYIEPSKGEFRTLAFQNYKEAIRLSLIENKKEIFFTDTYSFYKEELVSIDVSKQNKLKEEKINEYWDAWLNDIKTNFENGKSTLWSYVVIPREKDGVYKEITGSSFLIFSDCISENTGILINKYCQDLLIECITTHYYDELITVAARAAISQVMARNTAHNIANHVLNHLLDGDFLSKNPI